MKATLQLPDDVYRRVKAKAALQGRSVREVTIELYRNWLDEGSEPRISAKEWLGRWTRLGEEAVRDAPTGSLSVREILEADRNRLENT